ncbi:alternate-type signal peptide domain-containing protein [Leucobacter viscericola]|uniref:Alternate-type signal peptide domain-containing protein n=1 Tax=Leucobacter viscericola TaxID=2714935 RepID=A0A6G7XIE1_9MICO|nr:alternate-type signal peptide domain-containing protein [Leucobacter viscericola]QIK64384.1 alternate-type signal peptide domain-containing protein [Leucobacter viscericola]
MKKTTKAAVATAAAAVLLVGSAGTLAFWNDTANISGQNAITAGDLKLTATSAPTWTIRHTSGTDSEVTDITAVRLVPGDKLTYSMPATITAQGQNLRFKVGLAGGSIAAPTTPTAADTALAARLTSATTFTVVGATSVPGTTDTFDHKNNGASNYVTTIKATITWPFTGQPTDDNAARTGQVNLANFAITVTQEDASV